jgi:hypothetical protein
MTVDTVCVHEILNATRTITGECTQRARSMVDQLACATRDFLYEAEVDPDNPQTIEAIVAGFSLLGIRLAASLDCSMVESPTYGAVMTILGQCQQAVTELYFGKDCDSTMDIADLYIDLTGAS